MTSVASLQWKRHCIIIQFTESVYCSIKSIVLSHNTVAIYSKHVCHFSLFIGTTRNGLSQALKHPFEFHLVSTSKKSQRLVQASIWFVGAYRTLHTHTHSRIHSIAGIISKLRGSNHAGLQSAQLTCIYTHIHIHSLA